MIPSFAYVELIKVELQKSRKSRKEQKIVKDSAECEFESP